MNHPLRTPEATGQGDVHVELPVLSSGGPTIRRSRNGRRRAIVLATVQLLIIAHLLQWLVTGRTLSPLEPSESMEAVKRGVINAGAIFFALALLSTLVLGRWFCGWGCHIVMLQDGCGWILRRCGLRPKPFRSRLLLYVPFALAIYMFVWPAVYRWGLVPLSGTLHGWIEFIPALTPLAPWQGVSVQPMTEDFWHTFPRWMIAVPFLFICGVATVYFLGNKGFCTYGCPYGGFFAPVDQYATGRIRVSDACEHCGHCTAVCTSNVRVHEEVRAYGMVVDPGCMKCLDCVSVCPNDALSFGFGRPAAAKKTRAHPTKPIVDLTRFDEVGVVLVFLAAFFAFRGVYGLIPMLMAVGIAICMASIGWKGWRLLLDPSVAFHGFRLKYKGKLTRSGVVFVVLLAGLALLTTHSGIVNLIELRADRADRRVTLPRSAIFAASPMTMRPEMEAAADSALRHYGRLATFGDGGFGLLPQPGRLLRMAWLRACKHDFAESERLMRVFIERMGPDDVVQRDIMLLMRLQHRDEDAIGYARDVLREEPGLLMLRDEAVQWLGSMGREDEAIALTQDGIDRTTQPEHQLYLLRRLSLLLLEDGRLDEGIEAVRETLEIEPDNPAAHLVLGRALVDAGRLDEANDAVDAAIALGPTGAAQRLEIADLLDGLGRTLEADAFRDAATP